MERMVLSSCDGNYGKNGEGRKNEKETRIVKSIIIVT